MGKSTRPHATPGDQATPVHCGATNKQTGTPCKRIAGWGTDHKGQGRCKYHGGASPVKHARYSKITRPRLKELLSEQTHELEDPTDLLPEIRMLRALIQDYIERYDEFTDAILAWHKSWGGKPGSREHDVELATRKLVEVLRERIRDKVLGDPEIELIVKWFPVADADPKPRQVLDIVSAGKFIGEIGGLVDKIQKSKEKGSITLDTLTRVTSAMALDVERAASRHVKDESVRTALLSEIEQRWDSIGLDPGQGLARDEET